MIQITEKLAVMHSLEDSECDGCQVDIDIGVKVTQVVGTNERIFLCEECIGLAHLKMEGI